MSIEEKITSVACNGGTFTKDEIPLAIEHFKSKYDMTDEEALGCLQACGGFRDYFDSLKGSVCGQ